MSITREKILLLGEELFLTMGYTGFSYSDISRALKVKNAAIHYHFNSKNDLILEILKRERQKFKAWRVSERVSKLNASKQLEEAIVLIFEKKAQRMSACMIGNSAAAAQLLPEELLQEAKLITIEILGWLEEVLESGRNESFFKFQGESRAKASLIAASLAGALQLARITSKEYFFLVKSQIKKDLEITENEK